VLAPGGRLLCTWYLIDGDAPPPFRRVDPSAPSAVRNPEVAEEAVAFDESWLRERLAAHGLSWQALARGTWRDGEGRSLQDILVAHRG
jgi:hypothetical protein